jgi:nucleotide-binding universal stress UspA family protein
MIKDVMVSLEGTAADDVRLAAVEALAGLFESHVIGLWLNTLPSTVAVHGDTGGAVPVEGLLEEAIAFGDRVEAELGARLARLRRPAEVRRVDALAADIADIGAREARCADAFVALRPNGAPQEPEGLVEGVLFGSGRHLFLVPDERPSPPASGFNRVLIAWNGSREAARALAESLPYLHRAKEVIAVVIEEARSSGERPLTGADAINHLKHHGIDASLSRIEPSNRGVGSTLMAEAQRREADLLVMGGYGHSRLREMLLGGVTYELLHECPVPLLIAH